jgi:flagellar hook-associated protein 3 FlgL
MSLRVSPGANLFFFKRMFGVQTRDQAKLSEQVATGKRINRSSDDPIAAKALGAFKENLGRTDQYLRNISYVDRSWRQIESSVSQVNDLMIRARDLAIQGNSASLGSEGREAIAEEISQLSRQLLSIANTRVGREYIFSGQATLTEPFSLDANFPNANPAASFNGSASVKSIPIGESQTFETQIRLDQILLGDGSPDSADIFQTLANLERALRSNNIDDSDPSSVGQALEDLNLGLSRVQRELANIGGKTNRLDNARKSLDDHRLLTQEFVSNLQDVDLSEVIYEFQKSQTALQATIGVAGQVLGVQSLMDFLR